MHLVEIATLYIASHQFSTYLLILVSIIIEGEVALIVLGILAHTRIVPVEAALGIAVLGATLKTTLGYLIGYGLKRYVPKNKIFDFIEKRVLIVFPHFCEKPFWSLFFSKFIYGLNHFTIIFAGYTGVKLKTYVLTETISSIAWLIIMLSIGYFFSWASFDLSHDIKQVGLYLLGGIIVFLLIERAVGFIIEFVESEE
jgi:membrane protein DedA with SNARE-associated domain